LPEAVLSVAPLSGPAGIEITISGEQFTPNTLYQVYWSPSTFIGNVTANDKGEFTDLPYAVPTTTVTGTYQIIANLDAMTMTVAWTPFTVTGNSD